MQLGVSSRGETPRDELAECTEAMPVVYFLRRGSKWSGRISPTHCFCDSVIAKPRSRESDSADGSVWLTICTAYPAAAVWRGRVPINSDRCQNGMLELTSTRFYNMYSTVSMGVSCNYCPIHVCLIPMMLSSIPCAIASSHSLRASRTVRADQRSTERVSL